MDSKLDKPLDELIKQAKQTRKPEGGGGGGKAGRMGKPAAAGARSTPYARPQSAGGNRGGGGGGGGGDGRQAQGYGKGALRQPTPHGAVAGNVQRPVSLSTKHHAAAMGSTRLFVSNLDSGVTTQGNGAR
jgi:hypothetical protein